MGNVLLLFGFNLGRRCIRYMTSNSGYIVSLTSQMWRPFAKAESVSVWDQLCKHKWLNVVSVSQPTVKSLRKCWTIKKQSSRVGMSGCATLRAGEVLHAALYIADIVVRTLTALRKGRA